MQEIGLFCDLAEQGATLLIVLAVFAHRPLVSPGHLALVAGLTSRAHFNGGVLKRCGCHRHLVATLEDELHYFSVDQTVDGLPVDMSDEVTSTKASFLGGATVLHMPNNVMYAVDITVSNVDSDGSESKAIFLSGAVDGNGGAQHTDCWEKVSAG